MLHSSPEYYYTISRVTVLFSLHVFHKSRLRVGKLLWILFKHCRVCLMWTLILRKWNIRGNNFCSDFVLLKHQGHQPNTYNAFLWYVLCSIPFFKNMMSKSKIYWLHVKLMHSISDFPISFPIYLPKLAANNYNSFFLKLLGSFIYSIAYFLSFWEIHIMDSKNRQVIIIIT